MFSPLENKILKILGRRKLTVTQITGSIFNRRKKSIDANNGIAHAIRRINSKCDYHRLNWFLNGVGRGRGGKLVWKDKLP